MAMPGAIGLYRHYSSEAEFETDREQMLTEGWALEGFQPSPAKRSWLGRSREGVDAHYLRADWPAE